MLAASFVGCTTVKLLVQAGRGQLELSNKAKPISEVIKNERIDPRIRKLLAQIPAIKKFSEASGLKPTSNYTDYVQLDRPAAIWVVSACDPLEFKSKVWDFPIVGSFPYVGWFNLESAKDYAKGLKSEGYDVNLRGARAYSTLGWFRDAILSTMIPEGDEALGELVNVVLHESVHATLYVKGQSYFDESLAVFVAGKLTYTYLDSNLGHDSLERKTYAKSEDDSEKVTQKLHALYGKLETVYHSTQTKEEKLAEKQKLLTAAKEDLGYLKRDLNNATLVQFKEYNVGMPEFETLFRSCGERWDRFLVALKKITPASFAQPQQEDLAPVLLPLARQGCKN